MQFPTGKVRWGIIGCGDVCEVKSGPALQKASRSTVAAVMRRDTAMAQDFARRHAVPRWYDDAAALIADQTVDAVYVATPPASHAEFAEQAFAAGKPVFCEKPLAVTLAHCDRIIAASQRAGLPLVTAYYRRALPRFERMREIVQSGAIGTPRTVEARQFMPETFLPGQAWKLDPEINGGGHFADMYSHVLDWIDYVFGPPEAVHGFIKSQSSAYAVEDLVTFVIDHGGVSATGLCCYAADREEEWVRVNGTLGSVETPFYGLGPVTVKTAAGRMEITVDEPPHVHQPLVERVIGHLLDGTANPCPPDAARRAVASIVRIYGND